MVCLVVNIKVSVKQEKGSYHGFPETESDLMYCLRSRVTIDGVTVDILSCVCGLGWAGRLLLEGVQLWLYDIHYLIWP